MIAKLSGRVVKGQGKGKEFGFPTLNMIYDGPLSGVYVAKVLIDGEILRAAVHIGKRPTLDDEKFVCETHVLNWNGGAPNNIDLEILAKIRDVRRFESVEDLIEQIAKDVSYVSVWFEKNAHLL